MPHRDTAATAIRDPHQHEFAALDRAGLDVRPDRALSRRSWQAIWPRTAAVALLLLSWQVVVWSGWKPSYVLPGPGPVVSAMWADRHVLGDAIVTTLRHALTFYLLALLLGTVLAMLVTRWRPLRTAIAPLLAGLQSMPSVAWVPFAILTFGLSTTAIAFVTIAGSAPTIASGAISGFDAVPPTLLRAGTVLGARGINRYRYVTLPAALPAYVTGMKQGWAFAWRSLMAGELIATIAGSYSLGQLLSNYQDQNRPADLIATMVVIVVIGLLMDVLVFSRLERTVLARRGLGNGSGRPIQGV